MDSTRCAESLPRAVFILSTPRSGSTLLRVMLGGHSALFSPPELNLLPFADLGARECALAAEAAAGGCDRRVGLVEAIMTLRGTDASCARAWLADLAAVPLCLRDTYDLLCRLAWPRRLVDKSTLNAGSACFLERSLRAASGANYVHLTRHPEAVIESLMRTYPSAAPVEVAFRQAEHLWASSNANVLRFFTGLTVGSSLRMRFEDLVREPREAMSALCRFLGIDFETALIDPYGGDRMTRGEPGQFTSLGDPNFHDHERIDPSLGEAWRQAELPARLLPSTVELAGALGYPRCAPVGGAA